MAALASDIAERHGRLDVLVNDIFGGDRYAHFGTRIWEHDLTGGLRMLRMGIDTHLVTLAAMLPLLLARPGGLVVEMTDGTAEYNRAYRRGVGMYYDLVKTAVGRITLGLSTELEGTGCTAVAVTPGWLRSEAMLDYFGVTEENWRDAISLEPHFAISESPSFVARGVATLAADPERARDMGRVLTSAELADRYGHTDVDGSVPDCWRYVVEVQDRGAPADVTGYR